MAFTKHTNGRTTIRVQVSDVIRAIAHLEALEQHGHLPIHDGPCDPSEDALENYPAVPVRYLNLQNASAIVFTAAQPCLLISPEALVLTVFDAAPAPDKDPSSGVIFSVELTQHGEWEVREDWYTFDAMEPHQFGDETYRLAYQGTLPLAIEA